MRVPYIYTPGSNHIHNPNCGVPQLISLALVRPFLKYMTESEIHAVMTGGFATIAGTYYLLVLPAIVKLSNNYVPNRRTLTRYIYPSLRFLETSPIFTFLHSRYQEELTFRIL